MKKALKINISGIIFHIDEDAYEKLKGYLKTVELYFSGREGGKEIIDDIESRIAELFQSRTGQQKQVITIDDVDEVTGIMGDPSDFVEELDEEEASAPRQTKTTRRSGKRLYRDPENSVLGGVCGGLGAYFAIDPVIIRILFAVLFIAGYGLWGLVYIILWIAIPRAVSISQRLEMRGERVTVSNIEKTVKEEYESVRENFKNIEKTDGYKQASSAIGEIFNVLGRIVVALAKVVAVIIGIALVFAGFVLLMAFLGVFFLKSTAFSFGWFDGAIFPVNQFLSAFVDPSNLTIMLVALFFAITIPLISIIYGGIKLVFNIRGRDRGIGIVALIIWIASLSVLFSFGLIEGRKFAFRGTVQENVIVTPPPSNTLYLQLNENVNVRSLEDITWFDHPFRGIYSDPERKTFHSRPSLSIRRARIDEPELIIERRARGASQLRSELNAEGLLYSWELKDSILVFDNLFSLPPGHTWNFPELTLRLNLPEDHKVHIGDRMDRIITSARTAERVRIQSMTGKKWRMTENGLERVN